MPCPGGRPPARRPQLGPGERTGVALLDAYVADRRATGGPLWAATAAERQILLDFSGWLAERAAGDPDLALRATTPADVEAFLVARRRADRDRRATRGALDRRLLALGRFYVWAVAVGEVARNQVPPARPRGKGG